LLLQLMSWIGRSPQQFTSLEEFTLPRGRL
jgi:hypothetical protein